MKADARHEILEYLVTGTETAPVPFGGPAPWRETWRALCRRWPVPIDRALAGGRTAEGLAGAFAAGYQAAVERLVPDLAPGRIKAVCVTEKGGVQPGAIHTRLSPASGDGGRVLTGVKSFVSGADIAELLLVACSLGTAPDGRNRIVLAAVSPHLPGVHRTPIAPLGFVPEITHAAVAFRDVALTERDLLPGDGWRDYVKPFRTIEDIHVTGALGAYLIGVGRRFGWPAPAIEEGVGMVLALRALASSDPSSPACHLALGGILSLFSRWLERLEPLWPDVDQAVRRRWQRDRLLLEVAAAARNRRLAAARNALLG